MPVKKEKVSFANGLSERRRPVLNIEIIQENFRGVNIFIYWAKAVSNAHLLGRGKELWDSRGIREIKSLNHSAGEQGS